MKDRIPPALRYMPRYHAIWEVYWECEPDSIAPTEMFYRLFRNLSASDAARRCALDAPECRYSQAFLARQDTMDIYPKGPAR